MPKGDTACPRRSERTLRLDFSALNTQTQVALPLLAVETGPPNRPRRTCPGSISRPAPSSPPRGTAAPSTRGAGAGGQAGVCCSHVELDCFEAYLFLYGTVGSLTFQITPFLPGALGITQGPQRGFPLEKRTRSFVCSQCLSRPLERLLLFRWGCWVTAAQPSSQGLHLFRVGGRTMGRPGAWMDCGTRSARHCFFLAPFCCLFLCVGFVLGITSHSK